MIAINKVQAKKALHKEVEALVKGIVSGLLFLAIVWGVFILGFGWHRFLVDFWPLDASRIGPNLCASMALWVLVISHNEARIIQKSELQNGDLKQLFEDMFHQILHPVEEFEESIAEAVSDKLDERDNQ